MTKHQAGEPHELVGVWPGPERQKPPKRMQSIGTLSSGDPDTDLAVGLWLLCRDVDNVTQTLSERGLWNGKMGAIEFADAHHMDSWKGFHHKRCKKAEPTMI